MRRLIILSVIIASHLFFGAGRPWAQPKADIAEVTSRVWVETDKKQYQASEEIVITITNDLDESITTYDQKAFCSIVTLERQEGTNWKEVRNCFSGVPSRFVTLKPHTRTVIKFPALRPSSYRVSLVFSPGQTFRFGRSFRVFSAPFRVG
jgi:hypothetical protein